MDKEQILDDIFNNDPLGLLVVKPKASQAQTQDERLLSKFQDINAFYQDNKREPEPNLNNVSEFELYTRLKSLRENEEHKRALEPQDEFGLLAIEKKEINSIDDIFGDDLLDILGEDSEGLFDFKHTPKPDERESADFVARRKPCKDFGKFEPLFKVVQRDLKDGKRKLIQFHQKSLIPGEFYVHNGVLLHLVDVKWEENVKNFKSGDRMRPDGRTIVVFENGTESKMKYQSLYKALRENGKTITQNFENVNKNYVESFNGITSEDEEAGFIYVLKSKSSNDRISSIENLYKIGFSTTDVQERIKNAEHEPTYLMAPVIIEATWQCYNMNPQKFEQLIHNFFGSSCVELDVFDDKKKRHTPREWFIVPLHVVEQAVELIISGEIVDYRFDVGSGEIVEK
ncbi:MAG: GIY-YIG nuclease family protein [Candidatus Kapabacteria bacterium]|jgi:hypothetical protein|nr:GIY-YIG nuclease family protein [Candidatus Kapabacteria bacterium]